jgi:ABC-type transporter Mla subunit MlaD
LITSQAKVGLFLTFSLGLFLAMLFLYGKVTRRWRGRQEVHVAFIQVRGLHSDARVLYNGLEVGRVRKIGIVALTPETLTRFAPFTSQSLDRLPVTSVEREELRGVGLAELDTATRARITGRNMVVLSLEVAAEGDAQRYREDDQVRILTTLMGSASVDIVSGSGPPLRPEQARILLGAPGDVYGALSQSLNELKDILGSVGEMVGGEASPVATRMANFDKFTERMDHAAGQLVKKLPETWDTIEGRLGQARERSADMARKVTERVPEWRRQLAAAQESLQKAQANAAQPLDDARKQVAELKTGALKALRSAAADVRARKAALPLDLREGREWTERVDQRVTAIENEMTYYDQRLTQGIESTRQALRGLLQVADRAEERLWHLAHYPWAVSNLGQIGPEGLGLDAEWRKALMGRHYRELRSELERGRKEFAARDASDRARAGNIQKIMQEMDEFLLPKRRPK